MTTVNSWRALDGYCRYHVCQVLGICHSLVFLLSMLLYDAQIPSSRLGATSMTLFFHTCQSLIHCHMKYIMLKPFEAGLGPSVSTIILSKVQF